MNTTRNHPECRSARRVGPCRDTRPGNTLVLVLTSLALLITLAAALLQASRNDRTAARQLNSASADYLENVARIELDLILDIIAEDVTTGSADKYDYPHNTIDPWLASTTPAYDTTASDLNWPHVSNIPIDPNDPNPFLHGDPINNGGLGHTLHHEGNPLSAVGPSPDNIPAVRYYPFAPDFHPRRTDLADADGDGITDSRFRFASMASMDGVQYIVATRIVDLSACVNINSATPMVEINGGQLAYGSGADAPRWNTPSELDFSRLLIESYTGNQVYSQSGEAGLEKQLREFIRYRFAEPTQPTLPTQTRVPTQRHRSGARHLLAERPRLYGNYNGSNAASTEYVPLELEAERALRYRNGLNNPNLNTGLNTKGVGDETSRLKMILRDQNLPNDTSEVQEFNFDKVTGIGIGVGDPLNPSAQG